jgi:hypothetical protein
VSAGRILPREATYEVEQYIQSELEAAARYDNREPFDASGVWSLHKLAADIYAAGWAEGEAVESERQRAQRLRDRDRPETSDV